MTRLLTGLLYGVSPLLTRITWAAACLLLALAGILATAVPAALATAVDPLTAMRTE